MDLLTKKILLAHHHKEAKDYDADILTKSLKSRKPRSVEEYESKEHESFGDTGSSETASLKKVKKVKHVFKTRKHGDNKKKVDISEISNVNDADIVKETIALDIEEKKPSGKCRQESFVYLVS